MQIVAVLLQFLLHKLKEIQLLFVLKVKTVDIGVLYDLPASDNFVYGLLEELKLCQRVVLDVMKQSDFDFDDWAKGAAVLLCFVVVVESLEVEHVLVQFGLSLFNTLFLCSNLNIPSLFKFFIFVAVIISSASLPMLTPIS